MENEEKRISSYIRDILSGRPIADVPKNLILKVHDTFKKNRAKYNISNTKYNQIIHEFENIEKRFKLIKIERQSITNNKTRYSQYSDVIVENVDKSYETENKAYEKNKIDAIVEKLINGESFEIIKTESIDDIIEYCKQKIDQLVKDDEFNKASSHQDLLEKMIQLSYERKYLSLIAAKKWGYPNKLSSLNNK